MGTGGCALGLLLCVPQRPLCVPGPPTYLCAGQGHGSLTGQVHDGVHALEAGGVDGPGGGVPADGVGPTAGAAD